MGENARKELAIVAETDAWALVFKPHGVPSAPLAEGEEGTLLSFFLAERPEARNVAGKKSIERGLLHRLDTGTEGLVLVAKTQAAYESLSHSQSRGLIVKRYAAFCVEGIAPDGINARPALLELPYSIASRFRAFGPGRKAVRPLFPGMRGYDEAAVDYETIVESIEETREAGVFLVVASLVRGFRHQVRAHLAYLGLPIEGDPLYNPVISPADTCGDALPLQLYAPGISFPDPAGGERVSFSLPLPDKMSR